MFENFLRARADQHENAETLFQRVLAQGTETTPDDDAARARLESRIGPPARRCPDGAGPFIMVSF
mgnify:CR=1 FL=1